MKDSILKGKFITLAITAGIAAYKTPILVRRLKEKGAIIQVIMTKNAENFVTPLALETVSNNKVINSLFNKGDNIKVEHIDIADRSDFIIIAPATANTINKLSNGIADNILTQTALAYTKVKLIAPAANTNMINNPLTKASLKMLKLCNFKIIETQNKELACRDIGDGAMAEPEDIFHQTVSELLKDSYWENRKVVLTGGGTIEKIDDVRYLSNFSSGKMAISLATALYYKGADVCLITTKQLDLPKQIHTIDVQSTVEMFEYTQSSLKIARKGKMSSATLMDSSNMELIQKKPYFFSVAAVSDYIPKFPQEGKIKKADIGDTWDLELKKNTDILNMIDKTGIYTVGFKAELDPLVAKENASSMLEHKKVDAVCLNVLNDTNNFGSNTNEIEMITKDKDIHIQKDTKLNVSFSILNNLKETFSE